MISDNFGRPVRSLRFSVTEKCNQDCHYCHAEGQRPEGHDLALEEIDRLLKIASGLGIRKIKITGGEPLVREDVVDIISIASKYNDEVSLTTNGTRLAPLASELKDAGLARANISLDTFDRDEYARITGTDLLDKAIEGIGAAIKAGLDPIKINMVVLPGVRAEDIMGNVEKAWALNTIPQIIELINQESNESLGEFESMIGDIAFDMIERAIHRRRKYKVIDSTGHEKEVEIVKPMHNSEFCANCTRLRVTSDGKLKPCLMHNEGLVDFAGPLRKGASDNELEQLFEQAIHGRRPYWR